MSRIRCRLFSVLGHDEATKIEDVLQRATGELCPCRRGGRCLLMPDLPDSIFGAVSTPSRGLARSAESRFLAPMMASSIVWAPLLGIHHFDHTGVVELLRQLLGG